MTTTQTSIVIALLAVIASTSSATVQPRTRSVGIPLGGSDVPSECREFLELPADSTSELDPWAHRLSLAACRIDVEVAPVSTAHALGPLVANLERAMAPSQAIYRDALARGPGQIRILAGYGLGMTHVAVIVRARRAIAVNPEFGGASYGGTAAERSTILHVALESMLASQRDAALSAFADVARLASTDPAAARANAVTRFAVSDSLRESELLQ